MQILHLDSSVLGDASASRSLSKAIVDELLHERPTAQVVHRDLVCDAVPHLTGAIAAGFRGPSSVSITDPATRTAPPAIAGLIGGTTIDWGLVAASAMVFAIPVLLFAFFVRRHLVAGVTLGAVRR